MRRLLFVSFAFTLFSLSHAEPPASPSLPAAQDIFTIAVNPVPNHVPKPYFTPESLMRALPEFKPGEAEIKVGARRVWQSGVIVLKNKDVLFWTTCRKNFIHIHTPTGRISFVIGDGKDDL